MSDPTPTEQVTDWLSRFESALSNGDIDSGVGMFDHDCYWRDLVSFTWNIKTMEGQAEIRTMLQSTLGTVKPTQWTIEGKANHVEGITDAWMTFETSVSRGKGHIRLKGDRCWTLLTTMVELKGYEEKKGVTRVAGVDHVAVKDRKNWLERKNEYESALGYSKQPYCVIIGGGQGGIALGARLKQLEVPTIIVEKNQCAGDSWRNRYNSLCLHDPVWYDHLPYLPFPDHWPVFSPKDKMGDWLEMYTKSHGAQLLVVNIMYQRATRMMTPNGEWTVTVQT